MTTENTNGATGTPSAPVPATTANAAPTTPATESTAPTGGTTTAPAETTAAATQQQPETTKPAAPVVPDKYDLKLPEGSLLDANFLARQAETAKALGLSQELAQKQVELASNEVKAYHDAAVAKHQALVTEWMNQAKTDKEIGGDAFAQNAELSRRVVEKYSNPDFMKMLDQTGYGNHPELVRVFARIGRAIGEDTFIPPTAGGKPSKKSPEDVLYGNPST